MWLKQSIDHYIFVNRIIGGEIDERDRKDYFSPSTDLFSDYCSSIIERYGLDEPGQILQREATDLSYNYLSDSSDSKVFTVTTSTGEKFYSRSVVLAIGPGGAGVSKIYPWKPSTEQEGTAACCHSTEIKSFPSPNVQNKIQRRQETNVVVVGGGLSSAQIVDMAVRKGVTKVWFLLRSGMKGMYNIPSKQSVLDNISFKQQSNTSISVFPGWASTRTGRKQPSGPPTPTKVYIKRKPQILFKADTNIS